MNIGPSLAHNKKYKHNKQNSSEAKVNLPQHHLILQENHYPEPTCGNQGKDPEGLATYIEHSDV